VVAQQFVSPSARRLRHPSWLDLRLLVGVLLVLVSVLLGAKVVATADRSVQVWALARDVSPGTTLAAADLRPARVRLFDSAEAYLRVVKSPAGRTVTRPMHAGELLPRSAVVATPPGAILSIPVQPGNAPGLARGQLVDVWSTTKGCAPVQVLSRVAVQEVRGASGIALGASAGMNQVIIRVAPDDARRVVAALGAESTIRLVVLDGNLPKATAPNGSVDRCGSAGPGRERSPGGTGGVTADPAPALGPSMPASQFPAPAPAPAASNTPTGGSR
jgi:hypothetical protein